MRASPAPLFAIAATLCALACTGVSAVPQFTGNPGIVATIPEAAGEALAVNGNGMEAFVANESMNRVAVIDQTRHVTFVAVGRGPRYIASSGFRFYTSNAGDNTVSVRAGFSTATSVPVGGFGPMAAAGDKAYQTRADGSVAIVDGVTVTATTFATGLGPLLPPATDGTNLYIANTRGDVQVYDISGAPRLVLGVRLSANTYAVTAARNGKFYVLTDEGGGSIVEVDAKVGAAQAFALPGSPQSPRALIVAGGTVMAGFANEIAFFDIATRNFDFRKTAAIRSFDFDGQSALAFALDADGKLYVIQPSTMMISTLQVAAGSQQVQFIYKTCNAFVSGPVLTIVHAPCGDLTVGGISAHALWWVPQGAESGWGLNVAHHGYVGILFATWFTYDANGQPTWLVMSDGRDMTKNSYRGALYRTTGPPFSSAVFDPSKVTRTQVGTMTFGVSSVNSAAMTAIVDGVTIQKQLAREIFSSPVPVCDSGMAPGPLPIYQDLWWNPNESGWGLNIAHQGNILFITWFTYDTDGKPTWFVGSDVEKTGNATYSGTLYKVFGPPMTASPWDPSKVTRMPVGSATLTFRDDDNGTFAYTVSGVSGTKAITREVFATPMTRCQ
jgi:hypothetical protein